MSIKNLPRGKWAEFYIPLITPIDPSGPPSYTASLVGKAFYSVSGAHVDVRVLVLGDPSANGLQQFLVGLPFGISIASPEDIIGVANQVYVFDDTLLGSGGSVTGDPSTDQALVGYSHNSDSAAARNVAVQFSYIVP